jgi:hypothetical protein
MKPIIKIPIFFSKPLMTPEQASLIIGAGGVLLVTGLVGILTQSPSAEKLR